MSTNPCLDAILVELVPSGRVAAISHYSHDPRSSSLPIGQARRFRATGGTAEEVIALKPGLVLASSFTPAATLAAYRRLGLRVATFGTAATLAEDRAQVLAVAKAVGAPERGRALVARIDAAVAAARPTDAVRPAALMWLGDSNLVNGRDTLLDDMLRHAGFRNASADYGVRQTGVLPLELVAARPPDFVLSPEPPAGADPEARRLTMRHRVTARTGAVEGRYPASLTYCGGPTVIRAMARLAEVRRRVVSSTPRADGAPYG